MQIEILGSGGAVTIPKPLCGCRVCGQAREKSLPYARTGPSVFVHGPNVLFDTPEEVSYQLNRSKVTNINACFYSHWHPDHTMGRRVWQMNKDWRNVPPHNKSTKVYLPTNIIDGMKKFIGNWEHLSFLKSMGLIELIEIPEGEEVRIRECTVKPIKLAAEYACGFHLQENGKNVLIVMDELFQWNPDENVKKMDVAIIPMGVCEFSPLTGKRHIPKEHGMFKVDATFDFILEVIKRLDAKLTVISHIEEPDDVSYDDLLLLEEKLNAEGYRVKFAFDTMKVDV